jgi:hypothetical protein
MEITHYMFAGVTLAISVLGFFLKKNKAEIDLMKEVIRKLEISDARSTERIRTLLKVVEDRRKDIQNLYEKTGK